MFPLERMKAEKWNQEDGEGKAPWWDVHLSSPGRFGDIIAWFDLNEIILCSSGEYSYRMGKEKTDDAANYTELWLFLSKRKGHGRGRPCPFQGN